MSKIEIDKKVRREIIKWTHYYFHKKEMNQWTKSNTVNEIVKIIKKEIKENVD